MTGTASYTVPEVPLGLSGPVARPQPGSLPLRLDLAHIALAGTHLAAHYVVPEVRSVGQADADLHLAARDDSDVVTVLKAGTQIEVLDMAGPWIWCCLGPQGPSGYLKADCLSG